MLPMINGKDFISCELEDLEVLLNNSDYAENEYIDYKKTFSIDDVPKDKKLQEQIEFRNDVCSFANANGGYLVFGIKENKGIPNEIIGVTIDNCDIFERNIKNYLQPIKPRIPYYKLKFIKIHELQFVVIMFIQHDYFAPYIHLAEQTNYKIFKRVGNSKSFIEYQELKRMFTQSLSIEKEIERFQKDRIYHYHTLGGNNAKFFTMHIIPETFLDSNYNRPMFVLERLGAKLSTISYFFECGGRPFPLPEGLRYIGRGIESECRIYNNGIAEFYYPLEKKLHIGMRGNNDKGSLPYVWLWNNIYNSILVYVDKMIPSFNLKRFYVVISIIGCKDVATEELTSLDEYSRIDRDILIFNPFAFEIGENGKVEDKVIRQLHLDFLLSLGIRFDQTLQFLIEEIYGKSF